MGAPLALGRSKVDRARPAQTLLAALTAADKRRWLNFWTDDESWIM
jgi:hypothetical protein